MYSAFANPSERLRADSDIHWLLSWIPNSHPVWNESSSRQSMIWRSLGLCTPPIIVITGRSTRSIMSRFAINAATMTIYPLTHQLP